MISSNNPVPTTLNSSGTHPTKNPPNSRRIIRCLIELNRPGEARDYLPQIKETPLLALTLVLQFQVSLRCDDEALGTSPSVVHLTMTIATKALEQLTFAPGFIPQMLYQCALDAQIQGKKELGFTVLKKILRHYNDDFMTDEAKKELRLPVLFRYLPCAGGGS